MKLRGWICWTTLACVLPIARAEAHFLFIQDLESLAI